MFIVSRRTANEYRQAIGSLVKRFGTKMKAHLKIGAVMGDEEDAQQNALSSLSQFEDYKYLMYFLLPLQCDETHPPSPRGSPDYSFAGHTRHALCYKKDHLYGIWERVLYTWKQDPLLRTIAHYFNAVDVRSLLAMADLSLTKRVRYDQQPM